MAKRKNKKIIITGAKGGTGISIVKEFQEHGYDVLGIDIKPHSWAEQDYTRIDMTDGSAVHDALAGAYGVVHFGSYPGDGYCSWDEAYQNIAVGGFHVFQACANLGIERIAYASSPELYGSDYPKSVPADESRPFLPPSIYGAAKENLESLAQSYCRWNPGMGIAGLRTTRIVYERSFNWRFKQHTEDPRSAADALWSYVDARDVASACRLWIESKHTGFEAFDVAAKDVCYPMKTAELVKKYLPKSDKVKGKLVGSQSLVPCKKLRKMLGWKPQWTWRDMKREVEESGDLPWPGAAR